MRVVPQTANRRAERLTDRIVNVCLMRKPVFRRASDINAVTVASNDERIPRKIVSNDKIPSPPMVAVRLLDLVTQPDVNVGEITKVLGADPKLSARLIAYCNSPIVGSKRMISSLQQAVMVLGMRTLRLLSLSFSLMDTQSESEFDYDDFWRNSLATAIGAKLLGKRLGANGDEAFLVGLVLNIGQIGIGNTYPEKLAGLLGEDKSLSTLTIEMESEAFGTNRYQVGSKLLQKWHFPERMVDALGSFDPDSLTAETIPLYLSQLLGGLLLSTKVSESQISQTKEKALALLDISSEQFDLLFDEMVNEWKGYEGLFDYDAIAFSSIQELEARAKESMIQISLGMDTEIRQITEEKKELEESAWIDALTKLKNRAAYDAELPGVVEYHSRQKNLLGSWSLISTISKGSTIPMAMQRATPYSEKWANA